jgi:hypothetical protein
MISLGIVLAAVMATPTNGIGLNYRDGAFVMNDGSGERKVVLSPPIPPPATVFAHKQKNTWMVWDERGLTVRANGKASSTRFPFIPTSPKVMSREQITATVKLIDKGDRQRDASGLAGHRLVGDTMFFLVRWADASNKPWLEVLVKVDASAADPKPEFVAKMPGNSLAKGEVDDQLFKVGNRLASLSEMSGDWGLSAYGLEEGAATFTKYGHGLVNGTVQSETSTAYFTDRTGYGTQLAGEVDLETNTRTNYAEARGKIAYVSTKPPILHIQDERGEALRYVDTGADVRVPTGSEARLTGIGVISWYPKDRPQKALLFEPTRWITVATWVAPPGGVTVPPPPKEAVVVTPKPPVKKVEPKKGNAAAAVKAATTSSTKKPSGKESAASMAVAAASGKPKATSRDKKVEPEAPKGKKETLSKKKPSSETEVPKPKKKPRKPVIEVSVSKKKPKKG